MLAVEAITPDREEQELILALSEAYEPLYRPEKPLPYHNFAHPYDEVLPEVLRLDALDTTTSTRRGRLVLIAATLTHDILPAFQKPANGETKEAWIGHIVASQLPLFSFEAGFSRDEMAEVEDLIASTAASAPCDTPAKVKLRRGDIKNVASSIPEFLSGTVRLFDEAMILNQEHGTKAPAWPDFVSKQCGILWLLLSQDLTLGFERGTAAAGAFNRAAVQNVSLLSKDIVLNPAKFVQIFGKILLDTIPNLAESSFINRAAS